jgi:type III restriction enzyme
LKKYFPNLKSSKEFITSDSYLGKISVIIESREENPSSQILFVGCTRILEKISAEISAIKETYIGTKEFTCNHFHEIFKAKTLHITDPHGEGEGISQNDVAIRPEWKINLSEKDWFIFNDNYGTTEEKAFVAFFSTYAERLKKDYEKVFLVRNERQLVLYSFDGGERFEPDYLLFLEKKNGAGYEQFQLFVEPKGDHLLEKDKWKEDFLLQIAGYHIVAKTFVDDNHYHIVGLPFFNQKNRMKEIKEAFERFLSK